MAILYDTDWGEVVLRASRKMARLEAWPAAQADVRAFLIVNVLLPYGMALVSDAWSFRSPAYSPAKTWYWVFMVLVLFNANLVQLFTLHRLYHRAAAQWSGLLERQPGGVRRPRPYALRGAFPRVVGDRGQSSDLKALSMQPTRACITKTKAMAAPIATADNIQKTTAKSAPASALTIKTPVMVSKLAAIISTLARERQRCRNFSNATGLTPIMTTCEPAYSSRPACARIHPPSCVSRTEALA